MLHIKCPHCGIRSQNEFSYGGDATVKRPELNKEISDQELLMIEKKAIPGPGSCGGMYTANTMACAIEALGMSLTNSSAQVAISNSKKLDCKKSAKALMLCIKKNIKPSDIITKKSLENAITVVMALGGSTNAVLHILAIANASNINLTLKDFDRRKKTIPQEE